MQSFVLPLLAAKQMAHALLPHADKHPFPKYLGGIKVDPTYAYATDRYTVGRFDHSNLSTRLDENTGTWIPREALAWVATLGPQTLLETPASYQVSFGTFLDQRVNAWYCMVRVEYIVPSRDDDSTPDVEVHLLRKFMAMHNAPSEDGSKPFDKFPPIGRLFDQFLPGDSVNPVLYRSDLLSRFTAYANRHTIHAAGHVLRITLPANAADEKLKPTLVEVGNRFKGLLMPTSPGMGGDFGMNLAAENQAAKDHADSVKAETVSDADKEES